MVGIVIFGYGEIGSFIHTNLNNKDLFMFGRKKTCELLKSKKLIYESSSGERNNIECNNLLELPNKNFIVIVTCKSYDIDSFIEVFKKKENLKRIICVQNGIGHIEKLTKEFGKEILVFGNISNLSISRKCNTFKHNSGKGLLNLDIRFKKDRYINYLVKQCKISIKFYNFKTLIWKKLVRLNTISLLTSYGFKNLGQIFKSKKLTNDMKQLLFETLEIAKSDGYKYGNFNKEWNFINELPKKFRSSMSLDFKNKKKTELEDITGKILEIARKKGKELTLNYKYYSKLKNFGKSNF